MNKPRPSILDLFDPLKTPKAVSSDIQDGTPSPDSDKENATPTKGLTMSSFFNRTYEMKRGAVKPVRLTRRLVDVGDVTVDEECLVQEEEEEDSENAGGDTQEFMLGDHWSLSAAASPLILTTPLARTPFAELSVHLERHTHTKPSEGCEILRPSPEPDQVAAVPADDVFVATPTNLPPSHEPQSGDITASPQETSDETTNTPPNLTTHPSEPSSTTHLEPSSTPFLLISTSRPSSGSSSFDTTFPYPTALPFRRTDDQSVNQHSSSFSLQAAMGGPEASFDLMNDRIELSIDVSQSSSFFTGMETGDSDSHAPRVPQSDNDDSESDLIEAPDQSVTKTSFRIVPPPSTASNGNHFRSSSREHDSTAEIKLNASLSRLSIRDNQLPTTSRQSATQRPQAELDATVSAEARRAAAHGSGPPPVRPRNSILVKTAAAASNSLVRPTPAPSLAPVTGLRIVKRTPATGPSATLRKPAPRPRSSNMAGPSDSTNKMPPPSAQPPLRIPRPSAGKKVRSSTGIGQMAPQRVLPRSGSGIRPPSRFGSGVAGLGLTTGGGNAIATLRRSMLEVGRGPPVAAATTSEGARKVGLEAGTVTVTDIDLPRRIPRKAN